MQRKLGAHGPEVSTVVFGAWAIGGWFWGGNDEQDSLDALHAAFEAGIDAVDTAPVYGFGRSERLVGRAIASHPHVKVLTKAGLNWWSEDGEHFFDTTDVDGTAYTVRRNSREAALRHEVEQSLSRLGRERIDLLQIHWPDPTLEPEPVIETLTALVAEGKIASFGVSNWSPEWLERGVATGPLTSHQPNFSLLSQDERETSIATGRRLGLGCTVYSPLEMGLLTGKYRPDVKFGEGDDRAHMPWFTPENIVRVNRAVDLALRPAAERHQATIAQVVRAATLAIEGITHVLVGARNPVQARDNAGAMGLSLDAEELALIERTFAGMSAED